MAVAPYAHGMGGYASSSFSLRRCSTSPYTTTLLRGSLRLGVGCLGMTFRMGRSWWSDEIGTLGLKQQRTGQDAKRDEIGTLGDGGKEQDGKSDREYGSRAFFVQGAAMLGGGGGGGWWWLHMHMGWGVCVWRDGMGMRLPKVSA